MTHGNTTGSDLATTTPAPIDTGGPTERSVGSPSADAGCEPIEERPATVFDPVDQLVERLLSGLRCEQQLHSPDDPSPVPSPVDSSMKPLAGACIWEGFFRLFLGRGGTAVLRIRATHGLGADPDPHITELLVAERLRAAIEHDPATTLTIQPLTGRALPRPAEQCVRHDVQLAGLQISLWSSQRFRDALAAGLPSADGIAEIRLKASLPLGLEPPPTREPTALILRWTDLASPTLVSDAGASPVAIQLDGSTPFLRPIRSHERPTGLGPTLRLRVRVQGTERGARILAIRSIAELDGAGTAVALHCIPANDGLLLTPSIDYRPAPCLAPPGGRGNAAAPS
ncbi:MAG: hypothetical protein EA398_10460 [Deltaproteobacteria bacterium]|nr:MAG: hypothetical protein EA398_10460 [Deltaproteobacteria bacterium]